MSRIRLCPRCGTGGTVACCLNSLLPVETGKAYMVPTRTHGCVGVQFGRRPCVRFRRSEPFLILRCPEGDLNPHALYGH